MQQNKDFFWVQRAAASIRLFYFVKVPRLALLVSIAEIELIPGLLASQLPSPSKPVPIQGVSSARPRQGTSGVIRALCRENKALDKGWDSDDEDLKRGLTKQDSLEFTRARLAKQREERKIEALRQLATRDDVNSVIDENAKVG